MIDIACWDLNIINAMCVRQGYVKQQQIGPIYSYIDKHNSIQFNSVRLGWIGLDRFQVWHIFSTYVDAITRLRVAFLALIQKSISISIIGFEFIHSFSQMAINNKHFFPFNFWKMDFLANCAENHSRLCSRSWLGLSTNLSKHCMNERTNGREENASFCLHKLLKLKKNMGNAHFSPVENAFLSLMHV